MTKKILALALVVMTVAVAAHAIPRRDTPPDRRGDPISHPLYGGSEGSYQVGTTAAMVCTGKCLLLGVTRETGLSSTMFLLRNTIATDAYSLSPNLLPFIHFAPDTGAHDNPIAFPTVFSAGISADANAAGAGYTVHYIDLDDD